jgi:hypothetical protein
MIFEISHWKALISSAYSPPLPPSQSRVTDIRLRNKVRVQSSWHMDKSSVKMKIILETKDGKLAPVCKAGQGHSLD